MVRLLTGVEVVGTGDLAPRALLGGGVEARLQGINGAHGVALLRYGRIETLLCFEDGMLYVLRPPLIGAALSPT